MAAIPRIPGLPRTASPPAQLADAVRAIRSNDVVSTGLTTTTEGEWAALVKVKGRAATPIAEVETALSGFPVIYEVAPERPMVARPAYPERGE